MDMKGKVDNLPPFNLHPNAIADHFQGNMQRKISGPLESDFLIHKDGEISDSEQSVCSKAAARFQLTISASLSATSSGAAGVLKGTQDGALDRGFSEILGLNWRKC